MLYTLVKKVMTLCVLTLSIFSISHAGAIYDGSMGTTGTLSGHFTVPAVAGKTMGNNLFHSFSDFNILTGESATFTGAATMQNIITRVTGGAVSTLDGILNTSTAMPTANFYLLNPAGVIFNSNAQLNVGGSFYTSTADYVRMLDGQSFSSTVQANELLSSSEPAAFGFLASNTGSIQMNGARLEVATQKTFSLSAVNIDLNSNAKITAKEGMVYITAVQSAGEVIESVSNINVDTFSQMGAITLSDSSSTISSQNGGGGIFIRAGQFMLDNSKLFANAFGGGQGGDINIVATDMSLMGTSKMSANAKGAGNAGQIKLLSDSIILSGSSTIQTPSLSNATGAGGNISIQTSTLYMLDQSNLLANTLNTGQAGNITINATKIVDMKNTATIQATSTLGAAGAAGAIDISTGVLNMDGTSSLLVSSKGAGNAGDINISAQAVSLSNGAAVQSTSSSSGRGGSIDINSSSLAMHNTSNLLASAKGSGQAGNILINTGNMTLSANASIQSESLGTGDGGSISILASHINMSEKSDIKARSLGQGNAGNINIDATTLFMSSDAVISSSSLATIANAGSITANLTDEIRMQSGASISTEAILGGGGIINLNAINILRMENSLISSQVANGTGNGGDINIDPRFVVLNASIISANAIGGNGGNINIFAGNFIQSFDSQVTASSQFGLTGNIRIDSPEIDVSQGLSKLPVQFLDASQWAHKACQAKGNSSFAIQKGDALSHTPDDWQASPTSSNHHEINNTSVGMLQRAFTGR